MPTTDPQRKRRRQEMAERISLRPLEPTEALRDLLATPPEPKSAKAPKKAESQNPKKLSIP